MRGNPYVVAFVLAGALVLGASGVGLIARAQTAQSTPAAQTPQPPNMAEMMKRHQQMMTDMKAADAKLDDLVAKMNTANGDAKVTAIVVCRQRIGAAAEDDARAHEHDG